MTKLVKNYLGSQLVVAVVMCLHSFMTITLSTTT